MADQLQLPQDPVFGMQPSFLAQKAPRQAPAAPSTPGIEQPTGATRLQTLYQGVQSAQKKVEESSKARDEIAQGEALLKTEKEAQQARIQADSLRQQQEAIQPLTEQLSEKQQEAAARFEPTQDTVKDLAGLFGLIGIVGVGLGRGPKGNAMQAMAAMNGMMEGYRQGRMDLYEKEKSRFETNLKSLHRDIQSIHERMADIVKLSATNRDQALQDLNVLFAEKQLDFLKQQTEKFGLARGLAHAESMLKSAEKAVESFEREERRVQEKIRAEEARLQAGKELAQFRESLRAERPVGAGAGGRVSPSGAGGAIQFRYNAAMTNAGNALAIELENAASLPLRSTPPFAAEVLTNPAKGMTDAAKSFFAQKITSEDARAMQQVFAGMQRAITTIEASGRPSGATEGAIKEFGKTMPRAGDNKINTYLFLAQAKQVMNILVKDLEASGGTETQINQAKEARDQVGSFITWTVKDVNNILAKGGPRLVDDRVRDSLQKSKSVAELNQSLAPSAAAPQKAMLNNRVIVVRGGKWVYEDDGTEAK